VSGQKSDGTISRDLPPADGGKKKKGGSSARPEKKGTSTEKGGEGKRDEGRPKIGDLPSVSMADPGKKKNPGLTRCSGKKQPATGGGKKKAQAKSFHTRPGNRTGKGKKKKDHAGKKISTVEGKKRVTCQHSDHRGGQHANSSRKKGTSMEQRIAQKKGPQ